MRIPGEVKDLIVAAVTVSKKLNADVVLLNKDIDDRVAATLIENVEDIPNKSENVFLILVTNGGDPNAAYTIARSLQDAYTKVILCIAGDCYSAGTLIVLGAHEVVIGNRGRLGPLDVQLLKRDELLERLSGLTVNIALQELQKKAFETFVEYTTLLKMRYWPSITFKTAMEVSATMTTALYAEIYKQIDPLKMGDDARSLQIATHYGKRLATKSQNLKPGAIRRLIEDYPSHEFIIDRQEATELFNSVRAPDSDEILFLQLLGFLATEASAGSTMQTPGVVVFPNTIPDGEDQNSGRNGDEENNSDEENRGTDNQPGDSEIRPGRDGPTRTERTDTPEGD